MMVPQQACARRPNFQKAAILSAFGSAGMTASLLPCFWASAQKGSFLAACCM
jgi:hypothetical protein